MSSREIWHEIRINASPRDVYEAVTDVENSLTGGRPTSEDIPPWERRWSSGFPGRGRPPLWK